MYQGKHSSQPVRSAAPRRRSGSARNPISLIVALVLLFTVAIGGSIAWLTHQASITNTMEPGSVPVSISESISGTTKNQITLTNEGNVQSYIRVAVISNSLDKDGNIVPGTSNSVITPNGNWTPIGGYYYYNGIVEPGASVNLLGSAIEFGSAEVVVMAQSVQVLGVINGQTASQVLWGHTYANGSWT
jgi:hypothetical protein